MMVATLGNAIWPKASRNSSPTMRMVVSLLLMMYSISGGAKRQLTATETALILAPPNRYRKYSGELRSR